MAVVDFHAHVTPDRYRHAVERDGDWFGLAPGRQKWDPGELHNPGFQLSVEERLADMDAQGVDVQILSPTPGFFQYDLPSATTAAIARECNDEVAEVVAAHPARFAGIGTLPMQDVGAAVAELERAMRELEFKGVIVNDHVQGRTWDEPEFAPFWEAAQDLGALVMFHQGSDGRFRVNRYNLGNTVGNLVERTITFGTLAAGGVLDRFPEVKILLSHGGGYAAFAAARMNKAAGAFEPDGYACPPPQGEAAGATGGGAGAGGGGAGAGGSGAGAVSSYRSPFRTVPHYDTPAARPPGDYLSRVYYDCCTFSEPTLRFLIDAAGVDRVVLGSDYPAPMVLTDPVNWINGLTSLSADEKESLLRRNGAALLDNAG